MIIIYEFLGYLLIPIIKINLWLRIIQKKEDKKRYKERFGYSKVVKPAGKLIWIHAASVGELKSAGLIINYYHKNYNILVTTTTLTAAKYAKLNYGTKIIHQFAPLDIKLWVNRFLNNWKPSLCIWIESDLWPITNKLIKKKSIKSILLNLRISPKSYKKWLFFKSIYLQMINSYDDVFVQSKLDKSRIEKLTNKKMQYIGNLKLSHENIRVLNKRKNKLKNDKKNQKYVFFASTHNGEEIKFLNLFKKIFLKYKNVKIIIAPRHPERSISLVNLLKNQNLKASLIQNSKNLSDDILIIDKLGQMNTYYSMSDIVILGGSFEELGGHNPLEPAINNCVILTGPHVFNWQDIFDEMSKDNACLIFKKINKLEEFCIKIIGNNEKIKLFKNKAKRFSKKEFFDTNLLFKKINEKIIS